MFNTIAFDVDGTLLDSQEADGRSLQKTLLDCTGRQYTLEELECCFSMTSVDVMEHFGVADVEGGIRHWNTVLYRDFGHLIRLFDGIAPLLLALKAKGFRLGLITSRSRHELALAQKYFDASLFEASVTADDVQFPKPSPEPMTRFLSLLGSEPAHTLYIGDTLGDLRCAKDAGTSFALATWSGVDHSRIPADYVVHHPSEILALLEALER